MITYKLKDLLANTDNILFRYGIFILGCDRQTTGFGKSSFARTLASNLAQCIAKSGGLRSDSARVVESKTIEGLKTVEFQSGDVIILDELKPSDKDSNVYMSPTMLKSFADVSEGITIRARNKDLAIPAGIPRIITGNASTRKEFFGDYDSQVRLTL